MLHSGVFLVAHTYVGAAIERPDSGKDGGLLNSVGCIDRRIEAARPGLPGG